MDDHQLTMGNVSQYPNSAMIITRIMIITDRITSATHPPAAIAPPISSTVAATAFAAAAIAFAAAFVASAAALAASRSSSPVFLAVAAAARAVSYAVFT